MLGTMFWHPLAFTTLIAILTVIGMVESGKVKIEINQRFALSDAAEAHRALEGRRTTGSSVLLP